MKFYILISHTFLQCTRNRCPGRARCGRASRYSVQHPIRPWTIFQQTTIHPRSATDPRKPRHRPEPSGAIRFLPLPRGRENPRGASTSAHSGGRNIRNPARQRRGRLPDSAWPGPFSGPVKCRMRKAPGRCVSTSSAAPTLPDPTSFAIRASVSSSFSGAGAWRHEESILNHPRFHRFGRKPECQDRRLRRMAFQIKLEQLQ